MYLLMSTLERGGLVLPSIVSRCISIVHPMTAECKWYVNGTCMPSIHGLSFWIVQLILKKNLQPKYSGLRFAQPL